MFKFDLLENEEVLNIYRQSESVLFKPALTVLVLIYFPWFFLLKYDLATSYIRLLFFWTFLVALFALRKFLLWLLNVYIVTNKRLVHVDYQGLFKKRVLETPLHHILNVSFSTKGFWSTIFKFGSVEVQATGLQAPIILSNLREPSKVKDFLWSLHSKFSKK